MDAVLFAQLLLSHKQLFTETVAGLLHDLAVG
jgi:hypothetical protein